MNEELLKQMQKLQELGVITKPTAEEPQPEEPQPEEPPEENSEEETEDMDGGNF